MEVKEIGELTKVEEVVQPTALESLEKADIDVQIATAKRYPRIISQSLQRAKDLACYDPEIAADCTFAVPRADGMIVGKSVRLAEIMGYAWGNLRYGGRIIDIGDRFVTAQGIAHDLENNIAVSVEVKRSIVGKNGKRYSDDLIRVTSQAAIAIAIRNAIFKVIPQAYADLVWHEAQKVARGEAKGLQPRLAKALEYFKEKGVSSDRVFKLLGIKGPEDVTWEHIDYLLGLAASLKTGEATIDELFPPEEPKKPMGFTEKKDESTKNEAMEDIKTEAEPEQEELDIDL